MIGLALVVILLGACGVVAGLRPSRHDRPTRLLMTLAFYSALVGLALFILFRDDWMAWLRERFDPEGLALGFVLGLVSVGGILFLGPAWGYAIGRTLNWARAPVRRSQNSTDALPASERDR
jgi:hypothetical protein